jgi:hypothetical protein
MNEAQMIFTLFFAISWGIVSNVLPKWKPFHYALFSRKQPRRRAIVAFVILNVLPWVIFILVLVRLRGPAIMKPEEWTLSLGFMLIFRAIIPGLAPFGCYRLWIALLQSCPRFFYEASSSQTEAKPMGPPNEPTVESLRLQTDGVFWNYFFALVYLGLSFLARL